MIIKLIILLASFQGQSQSVILTVTLLLITASHDILQLKCLDYRVSFIIIDTAFESMRRKEVQHFMVKTMTIHLPHT